MARRLRTEREIYWQDLIDRQGASKQSIADFCQGEGISTASLYAWRHRLQSSCRPVPSQRPRPALVPVRIVPEPSLAREAVIVEWPGGIVLRIATGCDAATLRTVVATLTAETREASSC
jgi:transposase-like protein